MISDRDKKIAEIALLQQKMAGSSVTEEEEQRALELERELGMPFNIEKLIDFSHRMSKVEKVLDEGAELTKRIDKALDNHSKDNEKKEGRAPC